MLAGVGGGFGCNRLLGWGLWLPLLGGSLRMTASSWER